ncbi:MAG: type II secretion system F family protein [Acidimicrobiia bacterium]|nr:type II secretion system F family protein [Acidimicrobiia bacterium]
MSVGLALFAVVLFIGGVVSAPLAVTVGVAAVHPMFGVVTAASWFGVRRVRRIQIERNHAAARSDESVLAVEMVALGLSAGVGYDQAIDIAAARVGRATATDLRDGIRSFRHGAPADGDSPTARMVVAAHAAERSGSSIATELHALVVDLHREAGAVLDRRLERLPVTILFPLALLILPGFLLVAVVPAIAGGLSRLGV